MESFVYEDIFEVPVLEVGVDVTSSDGEYIHPYDEVINLGSSASLTGGFTYTYSGNTLTPPNRWVRWTSRIRPAL